MEVDCDILQVFNTNPIATTKLTQQRVIASKSKKDKTWNNKKFNQKEVGEKRKRETKIRWNQYKTNCKMMYM